MNPDQPDKLIIDLKSYIKYHSKELMPNESGYLEKAINIIKKVSKIKK